MPDEQGQPAREDDGPTRVSLTDAACSFARAYPAWTGDDGLPQSWPHYVVGMRNIERGNARDAVRNAAGVRIAHHADGRKWKEWLREQRTIIGG